METRYACAHYLHKDVKSSLVNCTHLQKPSFGYNYALTLNLFPKRDSSFNDTQKIRNPKHVFFEFNNATLANTSTGEILRVE